MGTIYISIIMLCRVAQHLCNKGTSNCVTNKEVFLKYGAYRQIFSAILGVLLIVVAGNGFRCDLPTIIISTFSGLSLIISMACSISFLKVGTVALSSLFGTAGLLVPCVAGIFLFDEPMSVGQWLGVGLFFVAAYFLIGSSQRVYCKLSVKSFLILLSTMLSNGMTMLAQQMFTAYVPDGDVSVFSFLSFGIVGVILLIVSIITEKGNEKTEKSKLSPKLIGMGAVLSVAVFIINQLATLATAFVPPVILFTFINGGSTIIGTIVAAICFKEKLTGRSVTGVLLGVLSLIIIKAM